MFPDSATICLLCVASCYYSSNGIVHLQMMKKVTKYIAEQNERVWVPRGLYITNPVERGLRVVSLSLIGFGMRVMSLRMTGLHDRYWGESGELEHDWF